MDQNSKKEQQGSLDVSHIQFVCGGVNMGSCPDGTQATKRIENPKPKRYTKERPFPKMQLEPTIVQSRLALSSTSKSPWSL